MNAIETLLDKPVFQALGWTLIHFIWQGALIAFLHLSVSVLLRRFNANARYAAACGAMLLMLIAPVATMLSLSAITEPAFPAPLAWSTPQGDKAIGAFSVVALSPATETTIEPAPAPRQNPLKAWAQKQLPRAMPWLLALWFAGVLFLSLRFAGGLAMVHRLTRTETSPSVQIWQERLARLADRLRVSRPVRLCQSVLVESPSVIGWLRPVILLPTCALTGLSAEQLEALLAHELAHIRRYDYLVNLLQTSVETLFFYHPAVWWVSAQARQEREHCCDDLAVAACGDVLTYARALTALECLRGADVQLAVAANGGSLLVRIQRLLRGRAPSYYGFESGLAGLIALATIIILLAGAETALLSRTTKAVAVKEAAILTPSDRAPLAVERRHDNASAAGIERRESGRTAAPTAFATPIDETGGGPSPDNLFASETPTQDSQPADSRDFISEMAAAGLSNLKANEVLALKASRVTPQFVREMSSLTPTKLSADRVIALWTHGVTPAYAESLKAQGLANLSADQLLAFRIHGVTSEYIGELKSAGYGNLNPDSLIAFRIHGVTPAFIRQMSDIGFPDLPGDQLMSCGIHGVTPSFVQTMKSFIPGKLTIDALLSLRIHGVSPEMVKELEIMGYANLSADQLTAFRIHGITPAFIKSIQEAGYDRITADQLRELGIHGVTPEFIRLVKSRGFTDVTLPQLVELRRLNILPSAKN